MWQDFKKFAVKGNVMDLAVAVIIGGAFGKIVTSLVNDLVMPIIGVILGGVSFADLELQVGNAVIKYGTFLQSVLDFLIISLTIFMFVRLLTNLKKKEPAPPAAVEPPAPSKEEVLLAEIRDLLKQQIKSN